MQAQTKFSGEIVDKNGSPVAGVQIDFSEGLVKTVSDYAGKFSFTYSDTLKNRNIRFHSLSYKNKNMIINRGQQSVKVILLDSLFTLNNVVIARPKYGRFSDYSAQTVKMSSLDIVTNPAAMADMLSNMRVLPGVQANDNDGRLIIQGGSPEESKIYINDLLVVNPYRASAKNMGVHSRFTSDLFDGIILQSGGYNAEFGQALSGIVNLNTKDHSAMEAKTDIAVSSVYAGLTHIDQKPSYAYRADVMYSDLNPYYQLVPNAYQWKRPYWEVAADLFLTKEFNPNTKMTAQANLSTAGISYALDNVDSVRFNKDMSNKYLYVQANLYHKFNAKWNVSLASNWITDGLSATDAQTFGDTYKNTNTWNHNKLIIQYMNGKIINRAGAEYIHNPYRETYTLDREYTTRFQNEWASIFNDTKWYINNKLSANIGLRGEYSLYLNRFNLAPRFYLGYAAKPEHIFSLSLGRYFQLPEITYLKSDKYIDFTSVDKVTVSYAYAKKQSKFQWDVYYKEYDKAVTYSRNQPHPLANEGKGFAYGTSVFWRNNYKNLEYWLMYSYNNAEKQYDWFQEKVAPDYMAKHVGSITLKYWLNSPMSVLSANYGISSGTPYYSAAYPFSHLGTTPFRNNLSVSWSYLPKKWIIINVGCQNVLGYKNIYGYEFSEKHSGLQKEIVNPSRRFFFLGVFITLSKDKKLNQIKNL
ncbi:hypothetical protein AGMMS50239_03670 [Bacteroidia bacterium]|nr:hypothetical protein AGMMS50239_03670 [Bacteroidia bacterium]